MSARIVFSTLFCLLSLFISGCETASSPYAGEQSAARQRQLAMEPRGDFYIGRRFFLDHTHFWGYLRRPGESWNNSKLVIMNERYMKIPNRLPEQPNDGGYAYGDDHNTEYRIYGRYTGRRVFDPNSNLVLPEFELRRWEVVNESPGWLFKPNERFNGSQLLRSEPGSTP
ncbi:hypothetical protein [Prosthecobacter sp.]|uniref:hypothetical protein n=1 Tax=Prosthecobacter sp. TaxID=1965333 RepID=UPI002ABCAD59|nr:hypothetical protein [Prosthecobacter sp.]MDZ4402116.1 hypothetical protein [Prosthecobacter sp.]